MNRNIEKFLLWACLFKALVILAPQVLPSLLQLLIIEKHLDSRLIMFSSMSLYLLCAIPLKWICGAWLRSEAEHLGISQRIWFWTGFLFEFMGILLFYAYLTFCKKQKSQTIRSC